MDKNILHIVNGSRAAISDIPVLEYEDFAKQTIELLSEPSRHCVNYFAYPEGEGLRFIMCIADDSAHDILVYSCKAHSGDRLPSACQPSRHSSACQPSRHSSACQPLRHSERSEESQCLAIERFEREIAENHGIEFLGHPWNKPVRVREGYKFFEMEGEELHEVGVGPVHAGVIEPGHFRFICNGEDVLHLEIQLGWQHRGAEALMLAKNKLIQRLLIAEGLAGDTAISHSTAFSMLCESLCGVQVGRDVLWARTLAAELERMANHTGDLGAICGDVAYHLGASVYGRLRTPIVNFSQRWCGNRLGKGNVRPGYAPYAFTPALKEQLLADLKAYERDFNEMSFKIMHFPSVLSRLERTGVVSREQASAIGAVGMAAKCAGVRRDVRASHPYGLYSELSVEPVVKETGDVLARTELRIEEVQQSLALVRKLLENVPGRFFGSADTQNDDSDSSVILTGREGSPAPNSFAIALTEGWRGEICHCAVTGPKGELLCWKAKDPSFHNWMALQLAVRGNEISDFPICNKSFNLSYCGHDL